VRVALTSTPVTVFVDAENVRRSQWPNLEPAELVDRCRRWAAVEGHELVVVFDRRAPLEAPDVVAAEGETADDWLIRETPAYDRYWLVTSDRALRERAGTGAERVVGGGAFLGLI